LAQYNKSEFGTVGSFTLANNGFVNGGPDDVREDEYLMLAGTINYDLGFAELTTVTTSIEWEERGLLDVEIAGFAALNQQTLEERSYIGNETRLASAGEGPLDWVFGLFYSDDTLDIREASVAENLLPFGADADGNTVIADVSSLAATERQTIAVFGEISYELMEGKLVPLFGLRYYEEDFRSTTDSITNISVSSMGNGAILHDPALPLGSIPNSEDSGELRFNSTNPRFNLAYYPTDGSTYYVNIAKGFRGGNANTSALCPITTGCPASVPSDKLWSYEVGTKQSWLSGQVTWDAALYYMDWQGVREFVNFVTVNAQIGAGDAEIYGVDFSLTARPQAIPGLMLNMVGNWNSSELKNLEQIAIDNGAAEGDKVSFVPDWTFTLGVDYQREIADNLTLHVNTSFSHIEEQRSGFGDLAFVAGSKGFGDKRDLLRARIGVKTEKLGVYLVGANLLNEDGPINDGSGIVTLDYPRTLGLEISADY
jgi:outer membrane receptor protein involved in Fe transport